jgi:hypothetical protein
MRDHVRRIGSALSRRALLGLGAAAIGVVIQGSRSALGLLSGRTTLADPKADRGLRERSIRNLKQIGMAMHGYHKAHGHFPPAALTGSAGEPLLSWRVAILPYLAHRDLYEQFRPDQPWDGPSNRGLLSKMPEVYALQGLGTGPTYETFYRGFIGEGAFFDGTRRIRIGDITDGTVNTLMLVEADEPVAWTKPEELPIKAGGPLPRLGGPFADGFHALTCDGYVRFLAKEVDGDLLRRAITRNDGEVIELNRLCRSSGRDGRGPRPS